MQRRRRLHPYRPPRIPNAPRRTQTPTNSQAETSNDSSFRAVDLEQLTKALGFLAILFYVVGLLAINGYLFSIGVSDFSLTRPRFVYTGALLIITGVICYFLPALSVVAIRRRQLQRKLESKKATKGQVGSGIILMLLTLVLPVAILYASFSALPRTGDLDPLSLALAIYGAALLAGSSVHLVWNQANRTLLKVKSTERRVSSAAAGRQIHSASQVPFSALRVSYVFLSMNVAIVVILALSIYLRIFMEHAFPIIPEQFGGGRPKIVRLIMKEDGRKVAESVGVEIDDRTNVSAPIRLVYEGNETYVFQLTGLTVQLDKGLADGIVVLR